VSNSHSLMFVRFHLHRSKLPKHHQIQARCDIGKTDLIRHSNFSFARKSLTRLSLI